MRRLSVLLGATALLLAACGPGTWGATGSMFTARARHTATLFDDGTVLVAGGVASAELYNPGSGTWSATGRMTTTGWWPTATLLADGTVLVAGGYDLVLHSGVGQDSAEFYDPSSGTWSATASMTTVRSGHTATLLPDGTVLVAGGDDRDSDELASAELYDPSSETWSATASMTTARWDHTATLLADGTVLVAGGGNHGYLTSAELYDPSTGTWSATGSMRTERRGHTATLLADGTVLVAGGCCRGLLGGDSLDSAELYNPSSGTWGATPSMTTARFAHTATLLADGKVLVAGGVSISFGEALDSAELYDPGSGT